MRSLSGIQKTLFAVIAVALAGGAYFFYQTGASTFLGLTLTENPDLERGLVGHWTFDGQDVDWSSTTAEIRDRSGNNYHGDATTTMSSRSTTPGPTGQGVRLNGTSDNVNLGDIDMSSSFSLSTWLNAAEFGPDWRSVVMKEYTYGIEFTPSTTGHVEISIGDGSLWSAAVSVPLTTRNTWRHIIMTYDGGSGNLIAYIDGVVVGSDNGAFTNSNHQLYIGSFDGTKEYLAGSVDDVRIYNRALSADEVKRLYQLGATTKIAQTLNENPGLERGLVGHWTFDGADVDWSSTTAEIRDRSQEGNNGDASVLTTKSVIPGALGQALTFSRDDATVIVVGDDASINGITNAISVGAWVRLVDNTSGGRILDNSNSCCGDFEGVHFAFNDLYGPPAIEFGIWGPDASEVPATVEVQNIPIGEWVHVMATYDKDAGSGNLRMYVNGVLAGSTSTTTPIGAPANYPMAIGGNLNKFDGAMDDIRIYNRALSADEVKRLYQLGATTKVAQTITTNPDLGRGLVGHWTFDGSDISAVTPPRQDFDTGWSGPSTGSTLAGGTLSWANPDRVTSDDASYVTVTLSGTAESNYLRTSNFGFSIPSTATIDGVVVDMNRIRTGGTTGDVYDLEVRLVDDTGTIVGDNKASTTRAWAFTGEEYACEPSTTNCYGGSTDTWGVALTPAMVNDPDFGFAFRVTGLAGSDRIANVDYSDIVVYYHTGGDEVPSILDSSGQGNHGTSSGFTTWSGTAGTMGQALHFVRADATSIDVGNPSSINGITDAISVGAWIKLADDTLGTILNNSSNCCGNYAGITFYLHDTYGPPAALFGVWGQDASETPAEVEVQNIPIGEWVHLMGTYDKDAGSGNLRMYMNGILAGSTSTTTPIGAPASSVLKIGSLLDLAGWYFNGNMDDIRIYNRALSADEVKRLYELGQ